MQQVASSSTLYPLTPTPTPYPPPEQVRASVQAKLSEARAALDLPPAGDGSPPAELARGNSGGGGAAAGSAPSSPLSRKF